FKRIGLQTQVPRVALSLVRFSDGKIGRIYGRLLFRRQRRSSRSGRRVRGGRSGRSSRWRLLSCQTPAQRQQNQDKDCGSQGTPLTTRFYGYSNGGFVGELAP